MKRLAIREKQPVLGSLRDFLLRLFIGAALSANQIFGGYAPFALGFLSAMGDGAGGLAALSGLLLGAAFWMRFPRALRLAAAAVLIFCANISFADTKPMQRPLFRPFFTGGIMAAVEVIYLVSGHADLVEWTEGITTFLLAGLTSYYLADCTDLRGLNSPNKRRAAAVLALGLIMSLTNVPLPLNLSLGRILAGTAVLSAAFLRGSSFGTAAGMILGLGMDLRLGGESLFFTAAFAVGAFCTGAARRCNRILSAAVYALAVLFFLMPAELRLQLPLGFETLFSCALFIALPLRRGNRQSSASSGEETAESRLRRRFSETALAFRELSVTIPRAGTEEENPACIFDRAAEQVCANCSLSETCWKREYESTFSAFSEATPALLRRGRAESGDFSEIFQSRCTHLQDFIAALNVELTAYLVRQQYRARLRENTSSLRGQYAHFSDFLAEAGESVSVMAKPPLAYQIGAALRPRKGESISGDSMVSFESDSGRMLYLLLSDGMGTGSAAQKESSAAIRLLQRFLKADIPPAAALKTLNAAFALKGGEGGGFTTIDLAAVDLSNGDAVLYKYGAAPSYLRDGTVIRRISGGSLPAGLESGDGAPDTTHIHLSSGDFLVLTSDGIAEDEEDHWLRELIRSYVGHNPQSLVSLILADSLDHSGNEDDCAAIVLYLPEEETQV